MSVVHSFLLLAMSTICKYWNISTELHINAITFTTAHSWVCLESMTWLIAWVPIRSCCINNNVNDISCPLICLCSSSMQSSIKTNLIDRNFPTNCNNRCRHSWIRKADVFLFIWHLLANLRIAKQQYLFNHRCFLCTGAHQRWWNHCGILTVAFKQSLQRSIWWSGGQVGKDGGVRTSLGNKPRMKNGN